MTHIAERWTCRASERSWELQIVGSMGQFASGEARFLFMFKCSLIILVIETDAEIYTIDKVMRQAQGVI